MSGFRDDDLIRERALELALRYFADKPVPMNPTESRIVEVATAFYQFMNKSE